MTDVTVVDDVKELIKNKTRLRTKETIRSRWQRIALTQQDWICLRYLNEQRFLTFAQALTIYGAKTEQKDPTNYLQKRLRKLAHFGFLQRQHCQTKTGA